MLLTTFQVKFYLATEIFSDIFIKFLNMRASFKPVRILFHSNFVYHLYLPTFQDILASSDSYPSLLLTWGEFSKSVRIFRVDQAIASGMLSPSHSARCGSRRLILISSFCSFVIVLVVTLLCPLWLTASVYIDFEPNSLRGSLRVSFLVLEKPIGVNQV